MRCALEDDVSGDIRPDKLVQVIRESPRSIHALPRVEPDRNERSRFNMRSNWNWDLAERGSASVSATASRTWCTPLQVARILIGSRRQRSRTGYSHRQQLSAAPSGGIPRQIHYQADETAVLATIEPSFGAWRKSCDGQMRRQGLMVDVRPCHGAVAFLKRACPQPSPGWGPNHRRSACHTRNNSGKSS